MFARRATPHYRTSNTTYSVNEVELERAPDLAVRVCDHLVLGVTERRGHDGAPKGTGILLWDVCKHGHVRAEVMRDDLDRRVCEPGREHAKPRARGVEVATCEDEEDLETLIERLDRVRGARREAIIGEEHQALSMEGPKDARCRGRGSLVNVRVRTLQRALDVGRCRR